jgi:magnesium transporter
VIGFYLKDKDGFKKVENFQTNCWIKIESPNDKELESISEEYSLNQDLLIDGLDTHEIPRFEIDNKNFYIYVRVPSALDDEQKSTYTFLIILGSKFTITISKEKIPVEILTFVSQENTEIFTHFLTQIIVIYNKSLGMIGKQIRRLRIHPERVREVDILGFVKQESILNDYVSSLIPLVDIYKKLEKRTDKDEDEIEDLKLATEQLINSCKSNLKTIVNLREAYSALATNNLNQVIKLLTALTILLTVPTIVASIFGMNVVLPLADSPHAFSLIIFITILISAVILIFFKLRKWL